ARARDRGLAAVGQTGFTPSSRTRIVLGCACARSDTLAALGPFGPTRRLAFFTPSSRTRIVLGCACARCDTLAALGPFGPSRRLAFFTPSSRTRIVLGCACARSDTLAGLGPFGPTRRLGRLRQALGLVGHRDLGLVAELDVALAGLAAD